MSKLHTVKLQLTPDEIHRLAKGKTIQIAHSKLLLGIDVAVKKHKATKIARAVRNKRGVRLNLDPEEIEAQGGSFLDMLKQIGSFVKDKVFSNDIYKKNIAPLIKQGLEQGVDALSAAVGSKAPMLSPIVNSIGKAGVGKLGEVTGAYGLRRKGMGGALRGSPQNPALPLPDFSKPYRPCRMAKGSKEALEWGAGMRALRQAKRGGSFMPAGRY